MDNMIQEYEREKAIDAYKDITKEIKEADIKIPAIDRVTRFNDGGVLVYFFDKFFTVYEILTYDSDGKEKSDLAAVALGKHLGKGDITLIDFRLIGHDEAETFKEGIDAFSELMDRTRFDELPPTELHEGGTLDYNAIINKIAVTYLLTNEEVTIH